MSKPKIHFWPGVSHVLAVACGAKLSGFNLSAFPKDVTCLNCRSTEIFAMKGEVEVIKDMAQNNLKCKCKCEECENCKEKKAKMPNLWVAFIDPSEREFTSNPLRLEWDEENQEYGCKDKFYHNPQRLEEPHDKLYQEYETFIFISEDPSKVRPYSNLFSSMVNNWRDVSNE